MTTAMTIDYVRAYRGNPLIAALGTIRSPGEWLADLTDMPAISPVERQAPAHYRIHSTGDLSRVFVPRPAVITLGLHIEFMVRQGYVEREPAIQRTKLLNSLPRSEAAMKTRLALESSGAIIASSLLGRPGVGKSTSVLRILRRIKQKIYHKESGLTQVAWLFIEMPSEGGIKQFVLAFIYALERALGHELPIKVSDSASINLLLIHMAKLCAIYSIGILVVDEVQNLMVKKGVGRENMLNCIQTVCNMVHVPLLLIGTMKALPLFGDQARHARRVAAYGAFIWDRLLQDQEWTVVVDALWRYQWTTAKSKLTEEMRAYLYEATQGIIALLPAMLMLAQHRAILTGDEKVTLETLKWTYKNRFQPVHAMLNALRTGDTVRLRDYDDLWLPEFLESIQTEQQQAETLALKPLKASSKALAPRRRAAIELAHRGFDMRSIEDAIDQAVRQRKTTSAQIVRAAQLILTAVDPEAEPDPNDLRTTLRDRYAKA